MGKRSRLAASEAEAVIAEEHAIAETEHEEAAHDEVADTEANADAETAPPKKKKKKKTSQHEILAPSSASSSSIRHWNDYQDSDAAVRFKTGRWTKEEDLQLLQVFEAACSDHGLKTVEERQSIIVDGIGRRGKNATVGKRFWVDISETFVDRSVRAVFRRATRLLHPGNNKGAWSDAEISELKRLVAVHGPRWKLIAAQLGRDPNGVSKEWSFLQDKAKLKQAKSDKALLKALVKYGAGYTDANDVPWSSLMLPRRGEEECRARFDELATKHVEEIEDSSNFDAMLSHLVGIYG